MNMYIKLDCKFRTVDICGDIYPGYNPYSFSFDRFDTHIKLIDWIRHLSKKTWWSSELTNELIDAWEVVNSEKIPYDA